MLFFWTLYLLGLFMLCNFVYISVFNRLDQFDFVYGKKIILDFDDMSGSRTTFGTDSRSRD